MLYAGNAFMERMHVLTKNTGCMKVKFPMVTVSKKIKKSVHLKKKLQLFRPTRTKIQLALKPCIRVFSTIDKSLTV